MNLKDFVRYINPLIVERGADYYDYGRVLEVISADAGRYRAIVRGSDVYRVNVTLDAQGEITHSQCTCPYDGGPHCKHEVAVFFALAAGKAATELNPASSGASSSLLSELSAVLAALSPALLQTIILELAAKSAHLTKSLLCQYASDESELRVAAEIIGTTSQSEDAVRGCNIVLTKVRAHIDAGRLERALELCMLVLDTAVWVLPDPYADHDDDDDDDLIDYDPETDEWTEDDSGDDATDEEGPATIAECIAEIEAALSAATQTRTAHDQEKLFDSLCAAMREYRNKKRDDVSIGLLGAVGPLAQNPDLGVKMRAIYREYGEHLQSTYGVNDVRMDDLLNLQRAFLAQYGSHAELDEFLLANVAQADFRHEAVRRALDRGDAALALHLAEQALRLATQWEGITWKKYMIAAYAKLNDGHSQRALSEDLLFAEGFEWYPKLKPLYTTEEWPKQQAKLVERYEGARQQLQDYIKFLAAEGLTHKILELCQKDGHLLEICYPHLTQQYGAEVKQLFTTHIMRLAAAADSRGRYREVCRVIRTFRSACGQAAAIELVGTLKQTYGRRRAFVEELSHV